MPEWPEPALPLPDMPVLPEPLDRSLLEVPEVPVEPPIVSPPAPIDVPEPVRELEEPVVTPWREPVPVPLATLPLVPPELLMLLLLPVPIVEPAVPPDELPVPMPVELPVLPLPAVPPLLEPCARAAPPRASAAAAITAEIVIFAFMCFLPV